MVDLIDINIYKPGTFLTVTDKVKDGTYGVGSLYVLCFYRNGTNSSVLTNDAVVIRKGKGGKQRLDYDNIYTAMFTVKNKTFTQHLPIEDGKSTVNRFVDVEKVQIKDDLMELSNIEFIGWCAAYGQYLVHISKYSKHGVKWPEDKSHPLNKAINMFAIWENNPERAIEKYAINLEVRADIITAIRQKEAELMKCAVAYENSIYRLISSAIKIVAKYDTGWVSENIKLFADTRKYIQERIDNTALISGIKTNNNNKKVNKSKSVFGETVDEAIEDAAISYFYSTSH